MELKWPSQRPTTYYVGSISLRAAPGLKLALVGFYCLSPLRGFKTRPRGRIICPPDPSLKGKGAGPGLKLHAILGAAGFEAVGAQDWPTGLWLERNVVRFATLIANDLEPLALGASRGPARVAKVGPPGIAARLATLWMAEAALAIIVLFAFRERKVFATLGAGDFKVWHSLSPGRKAGGCFDLPFGEGKCSAAIFMSASRSPTSLQRRRPAE
jgi:hypothetical protein